MDLGGRKAGIMPGLGLFVPGRKRTGSERSILSRPTTMTSPALRPSRRVAPNETLSPFAKNTKIVGTNSTNRLESTKPRKNELKTNSERGEKQRNKGATRAKPSPAPPIAARAKLFHLAKTCRAETNALADDRALLFDDRSGNVIENKESRSPEVKELRSWEAEARGGRSDADGLSLFDSQLWTSRLEFARTKPACY